MRPRGYHADDIEPIDGLTAVRIRPGMYVGDCDDGTGLHRLVDIAVAHALGEASVSGGRVEVRLRADGGIAVSDDGRVWPIAAVDGRPACELMLTALWHRPAMDRRGGDAGPALITALSERLELEVRRDGASHRQSFARGAALGRLLRGPLVGEPGATLTFWPDPPIFRDPAPLAGVVAARLAERALTAPKLRFTLVDERVSPARTWRIAAPSFAARHTTRRQPAPQLPEAIVDVALGWRGEGPPRVLGFADERCARDGGTHVDALREVVGERLDRLGATVVIWNGNGRFSDGTFARYIAPDMTPLVREAAAAALAALPPLVLPEPDALETRLGAQPDDEAAALVLADRLSAAGDPRGELIALEHALRHGHDVAAAATRAAALLDGERLRLWGLPGGFPFQKAYRGRPSWQSVVEPRPITAAIVPRLHRLLARATDSAGVRWVRVPHNRPDIHAELEAAGFVAEAGARSRWYWPGAAPSFAAVEALVSAAPSRYVLDYAFVWKPALLGELAALQGAVFGDGALVSTLRADLVDGTLTGRLRAPRLFAGDERAARRVRRGWRDSFV